MKTAKIIKTCFGDCTNNGASSRHDTMFVFEGDITDVKNEINSLGIDEDACLWLVKRYLGNKPRFYLTPIAYANGNDEQGPVMFGGNKADVEGVVYDIHDRKETWEENDFLSR